MSEHAATTPVCYRHTSRETWVRCARCERPICPDCMFDAAVGHQCPECVADGRRTQRSARTAFGGGASGHAGHVTKVLIGLNVLVALIGVATAGTRALFEGGLFTTAGPIHAIGAVVGPSVPLYTAGDGITIYPGIDDGGVYRLLTAMFIHYGLLHLLMNMWALWVLGRNLEAVLGPARFLALFLLSGLGGNVAAYLINPNSLSAGASTAVFGLFGAYFVILRKLRMDTSAVVGVLVVNLVLTFTISQISWAGHLGGLLAGSLVAVVLAYAPRPYRTQVQIAGNVALLVVLLALVMLRMLTH
ncbi:MAG: rhomboid family intramembrane serine protease [Actinobacteria bacterium]|nr:MAG: rhomboid family intramembrane serine protease [Actinomycetota bacterium]